MADVAEPPRHDTAAQRPMTDDAKASTAGYAWNPVSGRFVKKSGPTYLRLIKCGVLTDPNLFVVQRAAPDPAPQARAPAPARRASFAPSPQEGSDDDDDELAARIAELLARRWKKPALRATPRARVIKVAPPPARAPARGSGRRQVAELFDTTTDASESEY